MAIKRFYEQHKAICVILVLFLLGMVVRAIIAGFPKHILVLYDELYYYSYAENLAKGRGFPMIYQFEWNLQNRLLYSIIISPAFLTTNRNLQFILIAIINSLVLSSGIFPTYFLAKDVIGDKKWGVICGVLYILMPDMAYSISFMSDIPMLPLGLWIIYSIYSIFNSCSLCKATKMVIVYGIFQLLIIWTKKSGLIFGGVFLFMTICYIFIPALNKKNRSVRQLIYTVLGVVIFGGCGFVIAKLMGLDVAINSEVKAIIDIIKNSGFEYIKYYIYFMAQVLMAMVIIPFIIPCIFFRNYDEKGKKLLCITLFTTLFFTLLSNRTSLTENNIGRVHLRYLMFLWMPYFILFCKFLTLKNLKFGKLEWMGWIISLMGMLLLIILYHGPSKATDIDYTLLYWVEKWNNYHFLYAVFIAIVVVFSMILICKKKMRLFGVAFLGVWLLIQSYNNVMATSRYSEQYRMNLSEIEETEEFVREHPDDVFAVINTGISSHGHPEMYNYTSTKIADSYLNYPNVLRTSLFSVVNVEKESENGVYYIPANPLMVDCYFIESNYDCTDINYVIIPKDAVAEIDLAGCDKIELNENGCFEIYKLKDTQVIPHIHSFRYLQDGTQSFMIEDGTFFSQYKEGDKMVFTSTDEKQAYVLYGPYVSLPAGHYRAIIRYDYVGIEDDEEIGVADINGIGIDSKNYEKSLMSSCREVEIDFSSDEIINQFEIRVLALKSGVKPSSIELVFSRQ